MQRASLKYELQPDHVVVDVGAAPGGMSSYLAYVRITHMPINIK